MHPILDKIHSTGYWRINIYPSVFNQSLISSLTEVREIIDSCVVSLRGWDYPDIERNNITNGQDWIECTSEFKELGHLEYWRFFQSGQFIHQFACLEDFRVNLENLPTLSVLTPSPSGKYLSILSTLYSMTEIFEFASNLAAKEWYGDEVHINVSLNNIEGRQLFFYDRSRYLRKAYICSLPSIEYDINISKDKLISYTPENAMKATIFVFERFNWEHKSDKIFPEEQKKFLERRL